MDIRILTRITLPLASVNALTQAARTVMSTVGPILAVQYGLSAGELGLFSAALFASYCLAQVPAGIALDRWGPRRLQTTLCLVAAAGFALFAVSNDVPGFVLARLLTGIGVTTGLIGMLKGNGEWFPRQDVAKATGLGMMVGTVGSFLVTAPAQAVLPVIGWRGVIWCCASASVLVGIWNLLSVRDRRPASTKRTIKDELRELLNILRAPAFRYFGPVASLLTVLNFTYLGLWAGPWLRDVVHLGARERADVLLLYTVGLLVGGPLTGALVSMTMHHNRHPMLVPSICTIGLIAVQTILAFQPASTILITVLWIAFAILSACGPAAYAAVTGFFPVAQAGRVSTAVNTLTLAMVAILQIIIGQLVDLWPHTDGGGWDPSGYSAGLAITIVLQTIALMYAWARRQQPMLPHEG